MMVSGGVYVPDGWVPTRVDYSGIVVFEVILFGTSFNFFADVSIRIFTLAIPMFLMMCLCSIGIFLWKNDVGKDRAAYVRMFPYLDIDQQGDHGKKGILSRFEDCFCDLVNTAGPDAPLLSGARSSRWIYSDPTNQARFVTVGGAFRDLLEVGVSEAAVGDIPRIEAFFSDKGWKGSRWQPPSASWEGQVALFGSFILLLVALMLFLYHDIEDPLFLAGTVCLLVLLVGMALRNPRASRLIEGTASKKLVLDEEQIGEVLELLAQRTGLGLTRTDADLPPALSIGWRWRARITRMYRIQGSLVVLLVTRESFRGTQQGYIGFHIARHFKISELATKRLMRVFDRTVEEWRALKLSGYFFDMDTKPTKGVWTREGVPR